MKSLTILNLCLFLLIGSSNANDLNDLIWPVLKEGRWVFNDEQHFEKFLTGIQQKDIDNILKMPGFKSFKTTTNYLDMDGDLIIDHEAFACVLNEFGAVEIGNWVFRLNVPEGKCYVADKKDELEIKAIMIANKYTDLPKGVVIFSKEEDAFEVLEGGERCSDSYANINKDRDRLPKPYCIDNNNVETQYKMKLMIKYGTFTIFKWMNIEFKHWCSAHCDNGTQIPISDATQWDVSWQAVWRPRCKGTQSSTDGFITYPAPPYAESNEGRKVTLYNSTRALTNYSFRAWLQFANACSGTHMEIGFDENDPDDLIEIKDQN